MGMTTKQAKREPRTSASARGVRKSSGTSLSLRDLEIPVEPLLTREEEWEAGRKVRAGLTQLAEILPRHPLGYRRYLARMSQVVTEGALMFSWLSLRERMARDLKKATSALEKARSMAKKEPGKAMRHYEAGVKVLRTYPLDPETLFTWSKEVLRARPRKDPLHQLPRLKKVGELLTRTMDTLKRERNVLVLPNFRLVLKEVFRYHPTGMRHSDLFQEGVLGLHKAVFRFDAGRGTRFSTYATYWIRQAIRKALIDKSRMIRVPQGVQEQLRKEQSSLNVQEADRVRRIMTETMLFSAGESDDGGERNAFVVPDRDASPLDERLHVLVVPRAISHALKGLDMRSREVLQRRFGLGGERPQTLEEIGTLMNLSRERIRQIEREALDRMRDFPDLQDVYEDLGAIDPLAVR